MISAEELNDIEVKELLDKLNVSKANGPSLFSPKLLKLASPGIAPSMTKLFNTSVYLRSWPKAWKSGEWVPVYKKGDKSDVKNYRPVTVLDSDQLAKYLNSRYVNKLVNIMTLYFHHYNSTAHRNTHSCETTMIRLVEDWKLSLDRNLSVGILSMDLSKAYDCSQHTLVMRKLQAYGFDDMAIHILRSYFKERLNRVRLGSIVSDWKYVKGDVPKALLLDF